VTSRLAPPGNTALNAISTIALLLIAAWSAPALASSGLGVNCDRSNSNPQVPDIATAALTVKPVVHGIATASGDTPIEPISTRALDLTPRAEVILGRVFEREDKPLQSTSDVVHVDLVQVDSSTSSPPLASTDTTPDADTQRNNSRAESVTTHEPEISSVETRLPGVSDADLLRFRRQMYRTDI
jgi:hypothetical protein